MRLSMALFGITSRHKTSMRSSSAATKYSISWPRICLLCHESPLVAEAAPTAQSKLPIPRQDRCRLLGIRPTAERRHPVRKADYRPEQPAPK
jgi:hypothetical protein